MDSSRPMSVAASADGRGAATAPRQKNPRNGKILGLCGMGNTGRRTLGIFLLLVTVFLWTASNFLASNIFADDSYSKPYFITYFNVSFFAFSLIPLTARSIRQHGVRHVCRSVVRYCRSLYAQLFRRSSPQVHDVEEVEGLISPVIQTHGFNSFSKSPSEPDEKISLAEHANVALLFTPLYFLANYLVSACLEYTSVSSATIVSSTSSIFTLIFGAMMRVERFNWKNLLGVVASFGGIVLVSLVDISREDNDDSRGLFPHKSSAEIALGNAMAFASAIMYGIYAVVLKKKLGDEDRVDMVVAFGFLGLFSFFMMWPFLLIFHLTSWETFEWPPTQAIWTIVWINVVASYIADFCWAYSMLLTTPLVVTVGISMSIPLSLIVQMFVNHQYSSWLYWVGAIIVVGSFLLVNNESHDEKEERSTE